MQFSPRHRNPRQRQRGMTLLEMMIVLAILALVMGLVVGPKVMDYFRTSHFSITRMKVNKYAHEAYPPWAATSNKACPDKLSDLNEHMNDRSSEANDAWGHPLEMTCGASNPPGVRGIAVRSLGEDGLRDTADDIYSWK